MSEIKFMLWVCMMLLILLNMNTCSGNSNIKYEIFKLRMEMKP